MYVTRNYTENGIVEQGFAHIYCNICMMMVNMVLHKNLNIRLWYECASTVPKLENIMLNPHKAKCKYKQLYSKSADYVKHLRGY